MVKFIRKTIVLSTTGFLYTGLTDGRVVKINPETETFDVLTRMGDPPYDDCGNNQ